MSELVAVVILLVITLVVGALLYAYLNQSANVGSAASEAASVVNSAGGNPATQFYANAEVSASVVGCSAETGTCTIELTNTGNADTQAGGCFFSGTGGGTGSFSPDPAPLPAGGTAQVTCTSQGTGGSVGSQVTGAIELSNGATVPWTGNWG